MIGPREDTETAREHKIGPKLVDELLKGQDPKKLFEHDGLLGELKKALAERIIEAAEGAKFWLRVMTELKNRGT